MIATEVTAVPRDDDELAHVWFADRLQEPMRYVTLCRELNDLSPDAVCVERDDQKWSARGGVDRAVLTRNGLALVFSRASSMTMGVGQLEVSFGISDEVFDDLKRALLAIFTNSTALVVEGQ